MFEKPIGKSNIPNKNKEKPTIAESHPDESNIPAANSQAIDPIVTKGIEQGHGESGSIPTTNTTGSDTQTQRTNKSTNPSELSGSPSAGSDPFINLRNKYGKDGQKNNSESTNTSELSGSPSAGSDQLINLRKKYGSEPLSAETSNKNSSQETGEEKRF
ncbi:hypothetical protein [Aerosakkonema funiforme]|uniref:hypothetical protein n=1 Tax=Aerosakkonema funiforme TaxID=1246630 RepID=UPI0035B74AFF